MSKFSLILSNHVISTTVIDVYELCCNGESYFENFICEIETDAVLFNSLAGAIKIIEHSANLISLPKTKFRPIKRKNLPCKVYEAKKDDIRIYMFHEEKTGRVIISGGYKGNQQKDINAAIKTVKKYFNEKK